MTGPTCPPLSLLQGGTSANVLLWESELEIGVAKSILGHLERSPRPGPSQVAVDLLQWADHLAADGHRRQTGASNAKGEARPAESGYDGLALLGEVFDLMCRRLPRLAPDDPQRPVVSWFVAELGPRLGRRRLRVANDPTPHEGGADAS